MRTTRDITARSLLLGGLLAAAVAALLALLPPSPSRATSLSGLSSQLGAEQQREQHLASGVSSLAGLVSGLDQQIALVRSRETAVRAALDADRAALAQSRAQLARDRWVVAALRARLALAQRLLSRQVLSRYESSPPDLMSVLLEAHGFNQLLEQVNFLQRAEGQQQAIIRLTRRAKRQADAASAHLAALTAQKLQLTRRTLLQSRALAGMNALLQVKQAGLARAEAMQRQALAASQSRVAGLRGAIATLQAEQLAAERAAAERAAAAQSAASGSSTPTPVGASSGGSGNYVIPSSVVLCESGGQNLTPNSAGASGYYQIMPATWKLYGGSGSAAYLAPKSEQDAVARRIWNGGSGASNWVCSGIVGAH